MLSKYKNISILAILVVLIFGACNPSRVVVPLKKRENHLGASLGGPLIKYNGKPMPIPHSSITYARGFTDSLTAFASFYPTAAIFGNLQGEIGVNTYVWRNDTIKMAVTFTPSVNFVRNFESAQSKAWPVFDVNFVRRYGLKEDYFYAGLSSWIETLKKRQDGLVQKDLYVPSLQIGNVWSKERFNMVAEFKYILPYRRNDGKVVEYIKPIVPYGAMGLFVGFTYKFKIKELPPPDEEKKP